MSETTSRVHQGRPGNAPPHDAPRFLRVRVPATHHHRPTAGSTSGLGHLSNPRTRLTQIPRVHALFPHPPTLPYIRVSGTLSLPPPGFSPSKVLPVVLDVGTNNEALLADPLYMGLRQRRITGPEYYAVVDEVGACVGVGVVWCGVGVAHEGRLPYAAMCTSWTGGCAECYAVVDEVRGRGERGIWQQVDDGKGGKRVADARGGASVLGALGKRMKGCRKRTGSTVQCVRPSCCTFSCPS